MRGERALQEVFAKDEQRTIGFRRNAQGELPVNKIARDALIVCEPCEHYKQSVRRLL